MKKHKKKSKSKKKKKHHKKKVSVTPANEVKPSTPKESAPAAAAGSKPAKIATIS